MSGQRYDAMSVREVQRDGQPRSFWTRIGSAFVNHDGSIGVQLDCLPLDGKIILQLPLTREEKEAKYQARQQGFRSSPRSRAQPQSLGRSFTTENDDAESGDEQPPF
jgi:hypothetical protein